MREVVVAIPAYSGENHVGVTRMVAEAAAEAVRRGVRLEIDDQINNGMLPNVRNLLVAKFLAGSADDLVMVDTDNYCSGVALLDLAMRPVDVVGIPCRSRAEALTWPIAWLQDRAQLVAIDPVTGKPAEDGLIEVNRVGSGIIKLSRACLESMISANPDHWYYDGAAPGGKVWALFEYAIHDHVFFGEDSAFCRKWRAMGGQVWIEQKVYAFHAGKKIYAACLGDWLRGDRGVRPEVDMAGLQTVLAESDALIAAMMPAKDAA